MYTERLFEFNNIFLNGQMCIRMGEIYQVAELSLIRGGEIAVHKQRCDEITYIVSGKCKIYCDDMCYTMEPGEAHFVKAGVSHKIQVDSEENLRFICFAYFPNEEDRTVLDFYHVIGSKRHFTIKDNGTIKVLSEYLVRELYNRDERSPEMLNSIFTQMLITIMRILEGKSIDYHEMRGKKGSHYVMYKLLRYIDNEYIQIENVKSIAGTLSYSEYYLSHIFKEKMGMTIKEYLLKKKIAYAAELLRDSKLTVEEIAEMLKFSSPHSFRRAFKQMVSLTPTEYRRQV